MSRISNISNGGLAGREDGHRSSRFDLMIKAAPFGLLEKLSGPAPIIPYYHVISNERLTHICHLYSYKNELQFIADLDFLCRRYRPISLTDLLDCVKAGKKTAKGRFILTFDDGYSQMYSTAAPILLKKGIPAVFFINTDFMDNMALCYKNKASLIMEEVVGHDDKWRMARQCYPSFADRPVEEAHHLISGLGYRDRAVLDDMADRLCLDFTDFLESRQPYLTNDQIRKMIDMGFNIGAHSKDHPLYAELSLNEQLAQTIESVERLREDFDLPYSLFAFPHNDHLVGDDFFQIIRNYTDLTLGTGGGKKADTERHLQRISFEDPGQSAEYNVRRYFLRGYVHHTLRRLGIERD